MLRSGVFGMFNYRTQNGSVGLRPRHRNRVVYAFREFLLMPLLIVGGLVVLAVAASVLDRNAQHQAWPVYKAVAVVVPAETMTTLLSTVTPGLLTVVSIIFFVLLMAVQHQSATYSPVVLDQFLRRKVNKVFYGAFVGMTVYCLLVLALVPSGAILAGSLALLMTTALFVSLLVLVYSTVDQIRPSATVWMLQQLALRARAGQQPLLARCRAQPQLTDTPATEVTSEQSGHIVHIDGDVLARALRPVGDSAEIELHIAMGEHVVPGTLLAEVRGADRPERDRLADAVLNALTLGRMRDLDRDSAHAVDQLSSMAWSATAVSGDPEGARLAVETLRSLLVNVRVHDNRHAAGTYGGPLPLVYRDPVVVKILDGLTSVITASGQSGQHQTCSSVLMTLSWSLAQLDSDDQELAFDRLQRVLPTVLNHVFTTEMERAFDSLQHAMHDIKLSQGSQRIRQLKQQMRAQQALTPAEE